MNRKILFLLIFVLLISTAIKLYLAYIFSYHICGDTAITGLMAKQILRGDFPLFFYNGYYTIPIESLVISIFFFLFGISSYTLFLGPIFVSILFSITTFFLGKELKNARTGIFALIYTAFPPYYLFKYGTSPIGYLIELILLGNLIIYFTWKMCGITAPSSCPSGTSPRRGEGGVRGYIYFILLGVFGGLAFWTHYIALYYLIPSFIFISINLVAKKKIRYYILGGAAGLISFFIIGLPWWYFCITNDFICFKFPGMALPVDKFSLLKRFIFYQMPGILALYMSKLDFFNVVNLFIYVVSFVFFFTLPFLQHKGGKNWLFLLIFLSMMILFCKGGAFASIGDHRYVLPIYSIIPLMVAYFLDWLDSKKKFLGTVILLFLVFSNSLNIAKGISIDKVECKKNGDAHRQLMDFFIKNNIEGVYGRIGDLNTISFLGKGKIFASQFFNSDAPFDGSAQAADRIAYINDDWITVVLDKLCKSYEIKNIDCYRLYYNLKPWDYCGEEIQPDGWKAESNYNQGWVRFGFDRNLDRYWSSISAKTKGMYFQIEFPKIYKIYKFQIFNLPGDDLHFPHGYRVLISKDGIDWSLIDECGAAYPVFWSGPRLSWQLENTRWEVIFKPVEARFVRIEQIGESRYYPWEINEIIFYEYKGDGIFRIRDYVKSVKDIYYFLKSRGIDFLYADYWMSEKMRLWSKDKIGVLSIYNPFFPNRKNLSRMMELNRNRAIVVKKMNAYQAEKLLTEFELPYQKKAFGEYICYYFLPKTEKEYYFLNNQRSLYWIGTGIAKVNKRGFGELLMDYAKNLEGGDAEAYFFKAVKYFPADYDLRCKILEIYKKKGEEKLYKRELLFINHRLKPDIRCHVEFSTGALFLGISLKHMSGGLYKIDYFWKLKRYPVDKIFVFVHFVKDGIIVFQNDHPLLEKFVRLPVIAKDNVWKESYIVKFPPDAYGNECEIKLGLLNHSTGKRLRIKGSRKTSVDIPKIKIRKDKFIEDLKGKMVFQSNATGNTEIYTMNADGSNVTRLTNTSSDNSYPNWSHDGKSIAFTSKRDGNNEIYVMDSDGKNQRNLSCNSADDTNPSWHPDGKKIIFTSNRDGVMNFYLIDAFGTGLTKITDFEGTINDMAHISPNGKEIIFTSDMEGGWKMFRMDLESKNVQRITESGHCEGVWSHDGEKILFVSRLNSARSEICIMDKDGNNIRQLTDCPALDYKPMFSPDDKKIIFSSERDGNWELYIMDINDCKPIRITYTEANEEWSDWSTTD